VSSDVKAAVPGTPGWAAEKAGGGFTTDAGWLDFQIKLELQLIKLWKLTRVTHLPSY
jgi:hypothetical protein